MEDIEDMFKNESEVIQPRLPQTKRKIIKNKAKAQPKAEPSAEITENNGATFASGQCEE